VIVKVKRYAQGYVVHGDESCPEGSPWGLYKVPFLFATNGRPYIRQLQTKSGIWFLDARRAKNNAKPHPAWYSPEDLLDLLKQDVDSAHSQLKTEPMPYIDREYQQKAIRAVEQGFEEGRPEMLLAMATGTGKTRTCIGLCYRLLKSKRCRRILFLVDRTALGMGLQIWIPTPDRAAVLKEAPAIESRPLPALPLRERHPHRVRLLSVELCGRFRVSGFVHDGEELSRFGGAHGRADGCDVEQLLVAGKRAVALGDLDPAWALRTRVLTTSASAQLRSSGAEKGMGWLT
jgi:hypothetical protein